MKLGKAALPDGSIVLVVIEGEQAHELIGTSPDALIDVAMARSEAGLTRGRSFAISELTFQSPVGRPTSIRDFSAFEAHTKNVVESLNQSMNPLWYEIPVFYFSNPNCVVGDGETINAPRRAKSIDFELEVACVIGRDTRDTDPSDSDWLSNLAGFMLMNDWSARDLGAQEMKLFMGPVKAKDFATSFGPWLVTPDEFEAVDGRIALPLEVRVNGNQVGSGDLNDMYFTWPRILSHASADATLVRGDVIGSGTCGNGCLIEQRITKGKENYPWLKDGDIVELEAPKLGTLKGTIKAQVTVAAA